MALGKPDLDALAEGDVSMSCRQTSGVASGSVVRPSVTARVSLLPGNLKTW